MAEVGLQGIYSA